MIGRRPPETGAAESEELERLCRQLERVEAPFDEITRSRAEAHLLAELAREPVRRRLAPGWKAVLVLAAAAAAVALLARAVAPGGRARVAGGPEALPTAASSLQFDPYVVAPVAGAAVSVATATPVPEALVQPSSRVQVPAGWMVRASLGEGVAITLTGPARAWSERAGRKTIVHLDEGRLLASLEGGAGRRLEIVSPGAITDVVGTLFSVEVVGGASRVAVAHGRVQVGAVATYPSAPPPGPREIDAGQSWLTSLPEPGVLEPALADALADHERTPPPTGTTIPLSVTEAPPGAGVWVGERRIASAPAWVRVEPRVAVRLSAPARAAAAAPPPPALEPEPEPSAPEPEPPARAPEPALRVRATSGARLEKLRPPVTPPSAEPAPSPLQPSPVTPQEVTARTLFRQADEARAVGDQGRALYMLRALLQRFPRDPSAAAARYELALMEQAAGEGEAALRDLAAVNAPALEEPTHYLRCRILTKRAPAEAERCLAEFRRRFPASAHDGDALAAETALAVARGGCPAAQALLGELEHRHPSHNALPRLRAACRRGL